MKTGQWRSLEELAGRAAPSTDGPVPESWQPYFGPVDRRQFMRLVEAALASAGLAGCTRQKPEKILPYVVAPPSEAASGEGVPYATTMPFGGYGQGVLGETHMGRPTKIEGNPSHPATLGKSSVFMQASVLDLYDPDRAKAITRGGSAHAWADLMAELRPALAVQAQKRGAGLRILSGPVTSPTLTAQLQTVLRRYPGARWVRHDPLGDDAARAGALRAFGRPVHAVPHYDRARRILALDHDFLYDGPWAVRQAADFRRGRDPDARGGMTRLYAAEATPSLTGAVADHRLPVTPSQMPLLVRELARAVLRAPAPLGTRGAEAATLPEAHLRFVRAVADDLRAHPRASYVTLGRGHPAEAHALVHLVNEHLGAPGSTVDFLEPFDAPAAQGPDDFAGLVRDMRAGRVDVLVILGGNPVYDAPADSGFRDALPKVPLSIHLSSHHDETAKLTRWHVPESHYLESWGDVRAYDGTVGMIQPLIRPLYASRSALEMAQALGGEAQPDGFGALHAYWRDWHARQRRGGGEDFQTFWRRSLHDGVVPDTAGTPVAAAVRGDVARLALAAEAAPRKPAADELELTIRPDPTIWDGAYANNGWLQELPKPYLTLTWDNAGLVGPDTAKRLGLKTGDVVDLGLAGRGVRGVVLVMPGQAEGAMTVTLGYGRTAGGRLAANRGFDAYKLRTVASPWSAQGLKVAKTGDVYTLAMTERHHTMEGLKDRHPAESVQYAELTEHPEVVEKSLSVDEPNLDETLYPPMPGGDYAWGMAIDLSRCIGCNACTIACQSENNIPVVGKDQVWRERAMHWIRVDRYFEGSPANPDVHFQPVPCMQCEKAPCEVVCPVEATLHDAEGLNQMVYNRCVGTRYCSNNCPYKVRRFNFLTWNDPRDEAKKLVQNPDVTVRERGVMEKCTYCVQRITEARITAEKEGRRIRDGEVVPACAQACPTDAIVFGDLQDRGSQINIFKKQPRHYALLAELNTRPRTTYLARVRNPNPSLKET